MKGRAELQGTAKLKGLAQKIKLLKK